MMKLTFEQVLEYLESGKEDAGLERRIEDDPQGPRLREEAELFLELLRDRVEDEPDYGDTQSHEVSEQVGAMHLQAMTPLVDSDDTFEFRESRRRLNPKATMHAAMLATRAAGLVRELGVLKLWSVGPYVEPMFHPHLPMQRERGGKGKVPPASASLQEDMGPSRAGREKFDPKLMSYLAKDSGGVERRIRGRGVEIQLPDRVDLSGPIRLEVRDTRIGVPARGLKMNFMPEKGPYIRLVTNSKGIVELPFPQGPGVLRIETTPPQTVRIEPKIS